MSVSRQLGNVASASTPCFQALDYWDDQRLVRRKRVRIAEETRLNRLAKPEDIAHVMVQMMGEKWSYMSASIVDMTCGSMYGH